MKTWDGGVPGVVANNAETFGLQNPEGPATGHLDTGFPGS